MLGSQPLDDGTLRVLGVRITVGNQAREFPAQAAQLLDSSVDKTQFGGSELARRVARASLLESQKTRNLGERESHGLRALDEPQSVGIASL